MKGKVDLSALNGLVEVQSSDTYEQFLKRLGSKYGLKTLFNLAKDEINKKERLDRAASALCTGEAIFEDLEILETEIRAVYMRLKEEDYGKQEEEELFVPTSYVPYGTVVPDPYDQTKLRPRFIDHTERERADEGCRISIGRLDPELF